MMKPIESNISLSVDAFLLTVRSETSTNLPNRERPDQVGYMHSIVSIEKWLQSLPGIRLDKGYMKGWTGRRFEYEVYFDITDCDVGLLNSLLSYFGNFVINSTETMEKILMATKAPYHLWGQNALIKEAVNQGLIERDEAQKLSKQELLALFPIVDDEEENGKEELEEIEEDELEEVEDEPVGEEELEEIEEDELEVVSEQIETVVDVKVLGAQKLDEKLKKLNLDDPLVNSMTIEDKRRFLASTEEERAEMLETMKKSSVVEKKKSASEPTPPKSKPEEKKSKPAAKKVANDMKASDINAKLKEAGLWKSGMQFFNNEKKLRVLNGSKEERQALYKELEELNERVRSKQSEKAKANMTPSSELASN